MTIAINGFGRIGRAVFRALNGEGVVKINDLADKKTGEFLLNHDSVYGRFDYDLSAIEFSRNSEPDLRADVVIEATGRFANLADARRHDAKLVVITAPTKDETPHYVYGVNCDAYKGERVISGASCTTVAAVNILKNFSNLTSAYLTTFHSYTSTQNLVDNAHQDLRRARAAGLNLIPTTTGAARAVEKILPQLKGKISASAVRVPLATVSLLEIVAQAEGINKENLEINNEPLVSSDFVGDPRAAIVESVEERFGLIKVLAWYDNEFGYASQLIKLVKKICEKY